MPRPTRRRTLPPEPTKRCLWGDHWKPLSDFLPAPKGEMGRSKNCRECHEERKRSLGIETKETPPLAEGPLARVKRAREVAKRAEAALERALAELHAAEMAAARRIDAARDAQEGARARKQREAEAATRVELEQKKRLRREKRLSATK